MITRSDYMLGKATHEQYYGQFVTPWVRSVVSARIGELAIRQSAGPPFNDIPLPKWDRLYDSMVALCNRTVTAAQGHGMTLSDAVCIAKEAARQIKEEADARDRDPPPHVE